MWLLSAVMPLATCIAASATPPSGHRPLPAPPQLPLYRHGRPRLRAGRHPARRQPPARPPRLPAQLLSRRHLRGTRPYLPVQRDVPAHSRADGAVPGAAPLLPGGLARASCLPLPRLPQATALTPCMGAPRVDSGGLMLPALLPCRSRVASRSSSPRRCPPGPPTPSASSCLATWASRGTAKPSRQGV